MKKLILANWKLNPATLKEAQKLARSISIKSKNKAVLCPPTIYLSQIDYPNLGAQDCFWESKGAFTGQTSPLMLKSMKVKYSIIGHSERRAVGDTDEMINLKLKTLVNHGLTPILCVGFGTTVEQDDLEVADVLRAQLEIDLKDVDASQIIAAYEPVWAIGTGHNATPEHAEKIAIFVKTKFGVKKVLYGGSVNPANAKGFLDLPNIDGLLVGGASLIANHFNQIINL